jgi:uncharacterized protein (DUF433 family)
MSVSEIVNVDSQRMSGTACFTGTRVPVRTLIDYLAAGDTLNEFLEQFPTVRREQAVAFLERGGELLIGVALATA